MPSVRARQADRVGGAAQVAAHQGDVGCLDRGIRPRSHREAEVGLRERGGVVHAVADHRDDAALGLQRRDDGDLVLREHLGDDSLDADLVGDRASATAVLSPVSSTGVEAEGAQLRDRLAARRLHLVGHDEHAARLAVPRHEHGGASRRLGAVLRGGEIGREVQRPVGEQRCRARRATAWPSTTPDTPLPGDALERLRRRAGRPSSAAAARAIAWAIGCSEASSSAPASRSSSARSVPGRRTTSTSVMRPVVTVPVLSSTTVSTVRVDSSTSGPLIRMPSCAPRPVPTSSAVGVASPERARARDDEHGDGGGERHGGREAQQQPRRERRQRDHQHDRHEDARDPVGEALHLGLAGLRLLDQARHLRELGVVADTRGAHDEPAAGVHGRADHGVAGGDLDRERTRP